MDTTIHSRPRQALIAPRGLILLAAAVSFLFSVTLWFTGSRLEGIFVGLWVPSILSLGTIVLPRGEDR